MVSTVSAPGAQQAKAPLQSSTSNSQVSTSEMSIRAYISGLSFPDPEKTILKRLQKHPATFQCTLCPKRFTRSFNLRSHLRTHTDERPFVCYVCDMAFTRLHDLKTHIVTHTGEKKYVCGGLLNDGRSWGCGRRFARASNLARHFRSEAGKICINPVLVEKGDEGSAAMTLASISGSAHHHMNEQPVPTTSNSSAPITGTRSNLLSPYATAPEMGGTKVDWELWDDLSQYPFRCKSGLFN